MNKIFRRSDNRPFLHDFLLVYLDDNINEIDSDDAINTINKLQEISHVVHTFNDVDQCIDFITDVSVGKISFIIRHALGQTTIPIVHHIPQITAIYVLCGNKAQQEQWTKEYPKVKSVCKDMASICTTIKQAAKKYDQSSIPMSFVPSISEGTKQNLDQLDPSFMYTQLLKEIILTIDFEQQHLNDFIAYYRQQFISNTTQLKNIDKLEREYYERSAMRWYSSECFLYRTLNHALRTMEPEIVINMGFFLRDLHTNLQTLHTEQYTSHTHATTLTLYRGQGLSVADFDKLQKSKNGLISFNSFLSTTSDRSVSLMFADSNQENSDDLIGILFEITMDPNTTSIPFANIRDISHFKEEEEILFPCIPSFALEIFKKFMKMIGSGK